MLLTTPPGVTIPHGRRVLWRYLTAQKFCSLLATSCLRFANANRMTDPAEVTLPALLLKGISRHEAWAFDPDKRLTLLSCWTMRPREHCGLWKEYLGDDPNGVAIRSTVGRLRRALGGAQSASSDLFAIAAVQYDASIASVPPTRFQSVSRKSPEFQFESEVRAMILIQGQPSHSEIWREVPVDLGTLVQQAVIAPTAALDFRTSVIQDLARLLPHVPAFQSGCGHSAVTAA